MGNLSLYSISEEYMSLMEEIMENDGLLTPELEERLAIKEEQLAEKANNYVKIIKFLESQVELASKEEERLAKFKKSVSKVIDDNLKARLLQAVLLFGEAGKPTKSVTGSEEVFVVKTLKVGTNTLSTRRSPKVEILDEEKISIDFCKFDIKLKDLSHEEMLEVVELLKDKGYLNPEIDTKIPKTDIKEEIIKLQKGPYMINKVMNKELQEEIEVKVAKFEEGNYSLSIR